MNRNFAMTHFSKRFRLLRRRPVPRLMRLQRTSGGTSDTGANYFANACRVWGQISPQTSVIDGPPGSGAPKTLENPPESWKNAGGNRSSLFQATEGFE